MLIALLASAAVYAVSLYLDWLSPLSREVYDLGMQLRVTDEAAVNVVVVAIDRSSLDNLFPQPAFPISRHLGIHTDAVRKLDSAGAKLIVFDVLFDRLAGVADTLKERFASAITGADNVILAASIERQSDTDRDGTGTATEAILCQPIKPILDACKGTALIDMPSDADGVIRRCYYGKVFQGEIHPSIESLIHSCFDTTLAISLPDTGSFHIDYSRGFRGVETVSYERILTEDNWQHIVRDKIALIGLTNNGEVDRFKTPISRLANRENSKMSGVEIHAHATETLLGLTYIDKVSAISTFLIGTLILGLCVLAVSRVRVIVGVLIALTVIMISTLGTMLLIAEYSLTLQVGQFVAALVILVIGAYAITLGFLRKSSESMGRKLDGIKRDMDTAGVIQKNLQTVEFPENDKLEISASQESFNQVGGDYYDVVELRDGRIGILVADVSGKGVPGSLIMANLQGRFRQIAPDTPKPSDVLANLNTLVNQAAGAKSMFATLFYGIVDTENLTLTFANAGHCCPVLCSSDGKAHMIEEGGPMIGPFSDMTWDDHELQLSDDDVFCLYSDGISETWDKSKRNMFSEERVATCLEAVFSKSTKEIIEHILKECKAFAGGGGFDDDWTLLVFRIREEVDRRA